jgi:spore coat polysaccharide biosynthesis protein SpsF
MRKKIIGIIQCRMGSKRLPGKAVKNIAGTPLLKFLLKNLKGSHTLSKIVVATSYKKENAKIVDICNDENISSYAGSEKNVLSRFIKIIKKYNADIVVRLTGDNPLVDKYLVDDIVNKYLNNYSDYDYISNIERSGYPYGLFLEVFKSNALLKASKNFNSLNKEHVTWYIRNNPNLFNTSVIKTKKKFKYSRVTIDTQNDLDNVNKLILEIFKKNKSYHYKYLLEK